MTVAELIELLKSMPQGALIIHKGHGCETALLEPAHDCGHDPEACVFNVYQAHGEDFELMWHDPRAPGTLRCSCSDEELPGCVRALMLP